MFSKTEEAPEVGDKTPVYDLDAEEQLLGALIYEGEGINQVIGFLLPEHFYKALNADIYKACLELAKRGDVIDMVTVAHEINRHSKMEGADIKDYLSGLVMNTATTVYIKHHARIVWRMAGHRELQKVASNIERISLEDNPDLTETFARAEEQLAILRADYTTNGTHTLLHGDAMFKYVGEQQQATIKPWLLSPWRGYNGKVRFRNGTVTVIAGPSGMGKTAAVEQIAEYMARDAGCNCLYMYNELEWTQLLHRRACRLMTTKEGKAPRFSDLEDGVYADTDEMAAFVGEVANWPGQITLQNIQGKPVHRIVAEIKDKAAQGLADFIIVDYLQLIPRENVSKRNVNDARAIGIIMQELKQCCQQLEHKPPLIVVSQVTKGVHTLADCNLDRLRDSGEIGEYSNVVTFVFSKWDATQGECMRECRRDRGTQYQNCIKRCYYLITVKNTFGPKGKTVLQQVPTRFQFIDEEVI